MRTRELFLNFHSDWGGERLISPVSRIIQGEEPLLAIGLGSKNDIPDNSEQEIPVPLRGIEIRVLGPSACNLVTTSTELSRKYLNIPLKSGGYFIYHQV